MTQKQKTFAQRLGVLGAIASALIAVYAVPPLLGLEFPKPAWSNDVIELAGGIKANKLEILIIQRRAVQRDIWDQEDRIDALQSKGQSTKDARERLRDKIQEMDRLDSAIQRVTATN